MAHAARDQNPVQSAAELRSQFPVGTSFQRSTEFRGLEPYRSHFESDPSFDLVWQSMVVTQSFETYRLASWAYVQASRFEREKIESAFYTHSTDWQERWIADRFSNCQDQIAQLVASLYDPVRSAEYDYFKSPVFGDNDCFNAESYRLCASLLGDSAEAAHIRLYSDYSPYRNHRGVDHEDEAASRQWYSDYESRNEPHDSFENWKGGPAVDFGHVAPPSTPNELSTEEGTRSGAINRGHYSIGKWGNKYELEPAFKETFQAFRSDAASRDGDDRYFWPPWKPGGREREDRMDVYETLVGIASHVAYAKRNEVDSKAWCDAFLFTLPRLYAYKERFLNLDMGDVYFPSPSYWCAYFFCQVDKGLRDCDECRSLESIALTPAQIGRESKAYQTNAEVLAARWDVERTRACTRTYART